MSHLNYFEPYQSLKAHHEDQLTRAFLVVLKYSPAAMMRFYSYCSGELQALADKETHPVQLPKIHELPIQDINLSTQIARYEFKSGKIISVLITDESQKIGGDHEPIKYSDRGARYDGVIEIGDEITLLIENKPDARKVWRDQMNPSINHLPDESLNNILIPIPALLEWPQIIQHLSDLISVEAVSGMEKMLISDFLEFVDRNFVGINPYQRFSQCKNNQNLLTRRIKSVLETGFQANKPDYHRGWAHYVMAGLSEVKQIGVRLAYQEAAQAEWSIEISMYFGDIMQQARDLYRRQDLDLAYLQVLRDNGWKTLLNPHISMQSKNWYFFNHPENSDVESYVKYWQDNQGQLKQYTKAELKSKLQEWKSAGLIEMDESIRKDYEYRLRNVQETTNFNWCPGFRILYFIPAKQVIQLDDAGKFEAFLRAKFNEGLRFLGDDKAMAF